MVAATTKVGSLQFSGPRMPFEKRQRRLFNYIYTMAFYLQLSVQCSSSWTDHARVHSPKTRSLLAVCPPWHAAKVLRGLTVPHDVCLSTYWCQQVLRDQRFIDVWDVVQIIIIAKRRIKIKINTTGDVQRPGVLETNKLASKKIGSQVETFSLVQFICYTCPLIGDEN